MKSSHAASVTRSATSLLTSRLAVAGIALLFLGVTARLLTIEEMAVFAVYNTFCGLLTVICSLGLLTTGLRLLPGLMAGETGPGTRRAGRLLRFTILVYVAGALICTMAAWMAARPLARVFLKDDAFAADLRAAALAALAFGLYEASQLLLSGLQRFGAVGRYNVAAALFQRVLSLALFFPFGLKGYLAGFAAGSLAGAAMGFLKIRPLLTAPAAGSAEAADARTERPGAWLRYSMPFYADGYLRYFYMHADQLLVGVFLSPADLSVYFIAKRFIQYGQVLVSSLVDPLTTKVAEVGQLSAGALPGAYLSSRRWFVLLFVPLAVLLACTSPFLMMIVGGRRYVAGVGPLAVLFLSLPFFALFSHTTSFLYALGPPIERLRTNLASSLTQALGILSLMPFAGLAGLGLARIVGFGVGSLYARARLRRHLAVGIDSAWARDQLRCLLVSIAMAAAIVVPHLLVGRPLLIPLYAAPATALCVCAYFWFVLSEADRAAIARLIPGQGRGAATLREKLTRSRPAAAPPTPIC